MPIALFPRYDSVEQSALTPASNIPTLGDIKSHLRFQADSQDDVIDQMRLAALDYVREIIRSPLGVGTYTASFSTEHSIPSLRYRIVYEYRVMLPYSPVIAVSSFNYIDKDGNSNAVPSSDYDAVVGDNGFVFVREWPADADFDYGSPYSFSFTAGRAVLPAPVVAAVKMIAGFLFANRAGGDKDYTVPKAAQALLTPYIRPLNRW